MPLTEPVDVFAPDCLKGQVAFVTGGARGIGAAITARTVAAAPTLPAVLQPSEMAEPIYRRLGFAETHVSFKYEL